MHFFYISSSFSTNIQINIFLTEFHENWIINADFNIIGLGPTICEIFQFNLILFNAKFHQNRTINEDFRYLGIFFV